MAPPAARTPEFVAHCLELLESIGPLRARRMFGGWGIHAQGLFVGLIAFERLYLKADAHTEAAFQAAGGERFDYVTGTRTVAMRYWTPPPEAMDSPALMAPWARLALGAALKAQAAAPSAPAVAEAPEDDAGSSATSATRRRAMR